MKPAAYARDCVCRSLQVLGLRGTATAASRLESTSLIFNWGVDLQVRQQKHLLVKTSCLVLQLSNWAQTLLLGRQHKRPLPSSLAVPAL